MAMKALLVESETIDQEMSVKQLLLGQGLGVLTVTDPLLARSVAKAEWPNLVVANTCGGLSDVGEMCLDLDGTRLDFPRLIVSDGAARSRFPADAYLSFPFTPRQLSYRIKKAIGSQADRFVRAGDVCLDRLKRSVRRSGIVSHVRPKEMQLLGLLMEHSGEILSRSKIMKEVWETEYLGDTRTLEVHIHWLRRKVDEIHNSPRRIITVRGKGYFFQAVEEGDSAAE
jgi:DNA-binding response OmpR family regulator